MYVQTRASLAGSNLRCEGYVVVVFVCQVADNPLGNHQLIGRIGGLHGQELNLVLLVRHAIEREVAHLRVTILDLTTSLCDVSHALRAELVELGVGCRLVITLLVGCGEEACVGSHNIVLQLAHSLELHACDLVEGLACLAKCILGRTLQREAILVKIRAEHCQCRNLSKGVKESGREAGQDVEVAAASFDEGEEARSIDTLTTS